MELRPENPDARLKLGLNRINRGDLEGAAASLEELRRLEPQNPDLAPALELLESTRAGAPSPTPGRRP